MLPIRQYEAVMTVLGVGVNYFCTGDVTKATAIHKEAMYLILRKLVDEGSLRIVEYKKAKGRRTQYQVDKLTSEEFIRPYRSIAKGHVYKTTEKGMQQLKAMQECEDVSEYIQYKDANLVREYRPNSLRRVRRSEEYKIRKANGCVV